MYIQQQKLSFFCFIAGKKSPELLSYTSHWVHC